MINYNNKCFKVQLNSENGETSIDTIFKYKQEGNIVSSIYKGGFIKYGQLIGVVDELGCINQSKGISIIEEF